MIRRTVVALLLLVGLGTMLLPLALTHPLPDLDTIRIAASKVSRRDFCEDLRGKLPDRPTGMVSGEEARLRLAAWQAERSGHLRFLDLTGVRLDRLSGADLRFSILRRAQFERADLAGADLSCADLTQAKGAGAALRATKLDGAVLGSADLSFTALYRAKLVHANLSNANLQSADLSEADLTGALLSASNLDKAILSQVNLRQADYRPIGMPAAAPRLNHLLEVYPRTSEFSGLSALRKALVEGGDPSQARTVTYVIETWRDRYRLDAVAGEPWRLHALGVRALVAVRSVAFGLTVDFGLTPRRAAALLAASIPAFALIYVLLIQFGSGRQRSDLPDATSSSAINVYGPRMRETAKTKLENRDGLYRVTPKGIIKLDGSRLRESTETELKRIDAIVWDDLIGPALWFSVLSAFRFGYGSFTLSSWFAVMQPHEVEYRAVGPIRVVGGLQSLLSLYLLVLFVATLFGDVFAGWS